MTIGLFLGVFMLKNLKIQQVIQNVDGHEEVFEICPLGRFSPLIDKQDNAVFPSQNVELISLKAHSHYKPHYHKLSDAMIYIIKGSGSFFLDDNWIDYHPGTQFNILRGIHHGFDTKEQTLFLSIQSPGIIDKQDNLDIIYE